MKTGIVNVPIDLLCEALGLPNDMKVVRVLQTPPDVPEASCIQLLVEDPRLPDYDRGNKVMFHSLEVRKFIRGYFCDLPNQVCCDCGGSEEVACRACNGAGKTVFTRQEPTEEGIDSFTDVGACDVCYGVGSRPCVRCLAKPI